MVFTEGLRQLVVLAGRIQPVSERNRGSRTAFVRWSASKLIIPEAQLVSTYPNRLEAARAK